MTPAKVVLNRQATWLPKRVGFAIESKMVVVHQDMHHVWVKSGRVALATLLLTAGLWAQRYTGHDHAVFHQPPSAAQPTVKHPTAPATTGTKGSAKNSSSSAATHSAQHEVGPTGSEPRVRQTTAPSTDNGPGTAPPPGEMNRPLL